MVYFARIHLLSAQHGAAERNLTSTLIHGHSNEGKNKTQVMFHLQQHAFLQFIHQTTALQSPRVRTRRRGAERAGEGRSEQLPLRVCSLL